MLVLSRKVGEKIMIGPGVTLVVKRIAGQRVTLGIDAPHNVHIVRGELTPFEHEEVEVHVAPTVQMTNPTWEASATPSNPR
jgi:carbon storage regulator